MKQDEWRPCSLLLIVNAHAVNVREVAVFGVGNGGASFVKRNVRRPRKPKDGESNRRNHNQNQQNLQKLFHHLIVLVLPGSQAR